MANSSLLSAPGEEVPEYIPRLSMSGDEKWKAQIWMNYESCLWWAVDDKEFQILLIAEWPQVAVDMLIQKLIKNELLYSSYVPHRTPPQSHQTKRR